MRVSVILTVLNEGEALRPLLESLTAQTRPPDEIVIADGGSHDNTVAVIREYEARLPLRLLFAPGANISQGRNAAIRAAAGDIIAVTDAGVRCEPTWLEKLTAPFHPQLPITNNQLPSLVAGFFHPDPQTVTEIAMGATVLPDARDVRPKTFLPSSRSVAFRKDVWETVGGYPEGLDFSEDVVFDLRVRERFGPFVFAPEALVHFRPRGSLRALAKQYYQYARGDGKANLFPKQHAVRYFAYLVAAPLLIYAALTVNGWLWLLSLSAGLAYVRTPLRRLWPRLESLSLADRLRALALVPAIRIVGDVAKMAGYPAGVWWRMKTNPRRTRRNTKGTV
jgi:glycosyltransferase involved in cell wall biosynthesis